MGKANRAQSPIGQLIALTIFIVVGCQSKDSGGSTSIASSESAMASNGTAINQSASEQPIPPEKNPPGGIPRSQAFVPYKSAAGGYQLDVPKDWARTEIGPNVTFTHQLDGLNVAISASNTPPTPASVRDNEARLIQTQERAVKIVDVKSVKLPGGTAVEIDYTSNSQADSANKAMRLRNSAYLFFNNGTVAWITWWAPEGADVSALKRTVKTFKWQ